LLLLFGLLQSQFSEERMPTATLAVSASAVEYFRKYMDDKCKEAVNFGASLNIIVYSVAAEEITKEPLAPEVISALNDFVRYERGTPGKLHAMVRLLHLMRPLLRGATRV
jgi:hypothetical protein